MNQVECDGVGCGSADLLRIAGKEKSKQREALWLLQTCLKSLSGRKLPVYYKQ